MKRYTGSQNGSQAQALLSLWTWVFHGDVFHPETLRALQSWDFYGGFITLFDH